MDTRYFKGGENKERYVAEQLDALRRQRAVLVGAIDSAREALDSFKRYCDNPPVPPTKIVDSATSGKIFTVSRADLALLRLPDSDPRKQAVLEKMERQAEEGVDLVNDAAQTQYEEMRREYEARQPGFAQEFEVLQQILAEREKEHAAIQAEIDRLRDSV